MKIYYSLETNTMSVSDKEIKVESVVHDTGQEEPNAAIIVVAEESASSSKSEICDKKEDNSPPLIVNPTTDSKGPSDSKSSTAKIVRGTKRIKLDIGETSDKKGTLKNISI